MRRLVAIAATALATSAPAADGIKSIEAALRCERPPHPADVLLDLRQDRRLGARLPEVEGEAQCWTIIDGIFWEGAAFESVCAVVDDEAVAYRYEDLFGADGLSAADGLWATTRMPAAVLRAWTDRVLGPANPVIVESLPDGARLGCTSWQFPVEMAAR